MTRIMCPACRRSLSPRKDGLIRRHHAAEGRECEATYTRPNGQDPPHPAIEAWRTRARDTETQLGQMETLVTRLTDDRRAAETAAERTRATAAEESDSYRELLRAIWLYVDWRYVTKQLTTEQKELWADAVEADRDPEAQVTADRWWRS